MKKILASVSVLAVTLLSTVVFVNHVRAATTFTVTKVADTNDGTCDSDCSLREAITAANGTAGTDTINFTIAGAGPHTIQPTSALPAITEAVTINGCSEPDAVANTAVAPNPFNGTIAIEIDGQLAGVGVDGISITSGSSTIRCLAINRFTGDGIDLSSGGGNTIAGNYIGTSVTGAADQGNGVFGLAVNGSPNNTIGGTAAADRNIFSGNDDDGIFISNETADGNVVLGNYVGLNAAGLADLGQTRDGVLIQGGPDNTVVGGTATGSTNVVSGNNAGGVHVNSFGGVSTTNTTVLGNYIGTNYLGTGAVANTEEGIEINTNALNTTVGGTSTASRNIISGNTERGVFVADTGSTGTIILGNYIGTDINGSADLGNGSDGIETLAPATLIGGTASGARNVISGNGNKGIDLEAGSDGSTVQGNYIGTSADGLSDLGNDTSGVGAISDGDFIGGTASGARNVISGNGSAGVIVTNNSVVQGNYIGLDVTGNSVLTNAATTNGNVTINGGDNNTIGGSTAAARNVISGGSVYGVAIIGAGAFGGTSSVNNKVQGNYIGTDASGNVQSGFGATTVGVMTVLDAQNNLIGGTGSGEGNLIAGNGSGIAAGSLNGGFDSINNSFLGNSIHSNSGGALTTLGIDLLGTTANFATWSDVGVTPNDAGDTDVLSNHLMNFPVVSSISSTNGTATITYSLDINAAESGATGYRVEFFANDSADPSGNGEGQTYIGADTVSGDVTNRSATVTLPSGVSGTKYITAVTTMTDNSTDGFGHSSEFSAITQATLVAATSSSSSSSSDSSADGLADTGDNTMRAVYLAFALITSGIAGIYLLKTRLTN